jgi:hypothetical protein
MGQVPSLTRTKQCSKIRVEKRRKGREIAKAILVGLFVVLEICGVFVEDHVEE